MQTSFFYYFLIYKNLFFLRLELPAFFLYLRISIKTLCLFCYVYYFSILTSLRLLINQMAVRQIKRNNLFEKSGELNRKKNNFLFLTNDKQIEIALQLFSHFSYFSLRFVFAHNCTLLSKLICERFHYLSVLLKSVSSLSI